MAEFVTVKVNGQNYSAWKEIKILGGVNKACRGASIVCAAALGAAASNALFAGFTPVQIYASPVEGAQGDLLVDGYIDGRVDQLRAAHKMVKVRSKAQDAVDCSCDPKGGELRNMTPLQIAQKLDIYNVGFTSSATMKPIPSFRVTTGESLFRAVERACRDQQLTLHGAPSGIELWNAKTSLQRHAGGLYEGQNLEDLILPHDWSNRHSRVKAHGQKVDGHGPGSLQLAGAADDPTVPRFRMKILAHDADTDEPRINAKAQNHRDRAAGNSLKGVAEVATWRDEGGTIWTPGFRVWTESLFCDIAQDMIVESFEFSQDEGGQGTKAHLHLVDPRAYGGKKGKGNQSGSGWDMPSDS